MVQIAERKWEFRGAVMLGTEERDRAGDQCEPQMSSPDRTLCHRVPSVCRQ
jgi:hypothetical protein